jgi:hypothetical protein
MTTEIASECEMSFENTYESFQEDHSVFLREDDDFNNSLLVLNGRRDEYKAS